MTPPRRHLLAVALVVTACASGVVRPPASVARRVALPVPPRVQVTRDGADLEVLPRAGDLRRLVLHGRPAELRGGVLRLGRGRFSRGVAFAAPMEGGHWRFITEGGVWEADGFLALPRRIAEVGDAVSRGSGRACVLHDGAVAGVRSPDEGAVRDVAFSDDALGLAVTEPGLAWITRDGGRHWSRLVLDGAVRATGAGAEQRWLVTDTGAVAVDPQGGVTAADPEAIPHLVGLEPEEAYDLVSSHRGEFEPIAPLREGWNDGPLLLAQHGHDWGFYDQRDGSWALLPRPLPGYSTDPAWLLAGRLYARVGGDLYALGDDRRWSLRMHLATCGDMRCVGSADGARVACEARCTGESTCAPDGVWCESSAGAPPTEWRAAQSPLPWRVIGYAGQELLAIEPRAALREVRMRLGDGPPRPLLADGPAGEMRVDPTTIQVGRDGRVEMVAWLNGESTPGVLVGPPGGRFEWRAPPVGDDQVDPLRERLAGVTLEDPPRTMTEPSSGWQWHCEASSSQPWVDRWSTVRSEPWLSRAGVQQGGRIRLIDPDDPLSFLEASFATGADLTPPLVPSTRHAWSIATFDERRATLLHVGVDETSGDGRVEVRAIGTVHPAEATATLRLPGAHRYPYITAVARDGARAAAVVLLSVAEVTGDVRSWLVEVRHDGSMSTAPIAFAREGAWGPYVLDGVAGVARVMADGRVVGGPAGTSPRVLAARVVDASCPASARGDVRLRLDVTIPVEEGRPTMAATGRYGIDGATLCLRSITSRPEGAFAIGSDGEGWQGRSIYFGRLTHHRCAPGVASTAGR